MTSETRKRLAVAKTRDGNAKRVGMIDPGRIYNTAMLNEIGIGAVTLMEARRTGIVAPMIQGRDNWYLGYELIEWFKSLPRRRCMTGKS